MKYKNLCGALLAGFLSLAAQAQQGQPANNNVNPAAQTPQAGVVPRSPSAPTVGRQDSGVNQSSQLNMNQGGYGTNQLNRVRTNLATFGTNAYQQLSNVWTTLSNRFSTNGALSPASDRGATNRVYSTNNVSMTNRTSMIMQDQASTPADQNILIQVRQVVRPIFFGANNNQPMMPVHFISREGVVTVVGFVPDQEQRQRVITLVREVPGVVQVDDQLQLTVQANSTFGNEAPSVPSVQSAPSAPSAAQDKAATLADRSILVQLHQEVQPILGNSEPLAPVHFISREGVVTLVGVVPSQQQRQQILEVAQRTPGVVQVINQIQANVQANTTLGAAAQSTNSFGLSGSNQSTKYFGSTGAGRTNFFGVNTNLSLTGRTNMSDRTYQNNNGQNRNLPPGLQNRETLPPGLQKQGDLPPGLDKSNP